MDISRYTQAHRSALALPEIYVQDPNPSERSRMANRSTEAYTSRFSPAVTSIPMSIPSSRDPGPPPPLPPPKFVDVDPIDGSGGDGPDIAWQWSNSREEGYWGRPSASVKAGSSLYGSFASRGKGLLDERPDFNRRSSSASTIKSISGVDVRQEAYPYPRIDEGYASLSGTSIGSNHSRLDDAMSGRTGFQSSVHDKFRSNAQAYDKSLLQKLDLRRVPDNGTPPRGYPRSPFSASLNDASPTSRIAHEHQQDQKPLSLPVTSARYGSIESPLSRWADGAVSTVPSRDQISNGGGPYEYRSPSDRDELEISPSQYSQRDTSVSAVSNSEDSFIFPSRSQRGSYDRNQYPDLDSDFPMEETTGLRRLHIDDSMRRSDGHSPQSAAGQKRRASSPPRDECHALHTVSSASDLYRRRESLSKTSPAPRIHSNHGSVSSTASGPRHSSYNSTLSIAASSITTMSSSYGRLSPGGTSPGAVSPRTIDSCDSAYGTSSSLNTSPGGSYSRPVHQRTLSETRPITTLRKPTELPIHTKASNSKSHGSFVCECCPKKPKTFDTEEELSAHEAEKQYECAYCKNRFKNKNEAERHQNSLHLRRHSWSCAAISGYAAVFHSSSTHPTEADVCGYCGDEFSRSGPNCGDGRVITDRDWQVRIQHLVDIHKFGECNQAKKFFRADHFRQHLKHSHAGTSGKWTNMLENACMKDEPLPEPIRGPDRLSTSSQGAARPDRITEEDEQL